MNESAITPELLAILRCPENHQPLALAEPAVVEQLRRRQQQGELVDVSGRAIQGRIDAVLVRQDGQLAYLVLDGIPRMLADEAVRLEQTDSSA